MNIQYRYELPKLMRELDLPMIAAILGCAEGYDSADLLAGGIEKLYVIDAWETHSEKFGDISSNQDWHDKNFEEALLRLGRFPKPRYEILRGLTTEMAEKVPDNSCGMIYLDAGHSYEDVTADLWAYIDKLVDGGICAGHDYMSEAYGVYKAVNDFVDGRWEIKVIPENGQKENMSFYFIVC